MSIFKDVKFLQELVIDNQEQGDGNGTTDYTVDSGTDQDTAPESQQNDQGDQNTEPEPQDNENPPEDAGGDEETTDYTAQGDPDMDMDMGDPEGGDGGESSGDSGSSNENEPSTEAKTPDQIKQLEDELFASLSPAQLEVKHRELKRLYSEMFELTENLIDRINDIPKNSKYLNTIKFVSDKLAELRDMIVTYMENTYSTLSYTENAINYNKFLAILHGINKVIVEIKAEEA